MAKQVKQLTTKQFDKLFPNEEACDRYLISRRWPKRVLCPRCDSPRVYPLESMKFKWECPDCRHGGAYRFSHLVGTIFENTNVDLRDWFKVIHLMMTSKKGMSARQIQRYMGFGSYKTAWYMCHRIRAALQDKQFKKLMGIVEIDETYIGPRSGRKNNKRSKSPVAGAVSRKGTLVARVLKSVRAPDLSAFVRATVSDKVSLLVTDDFASYRKVRKEYPSATVNHSEGEYVVGAIHTNTIEGFWSLVKRGIVGNYHKVSRKYLPLYIAEFEFRYNNRENADIFGSGYSKMLRRKNWTARQTPEIFSSNQPKQLEMF